MAAATSPAMGADTATAGFRPQLRTTPIGDFIAEGLAQLMTNQPEGLAAAERAERRDSEQYEEEAYKLMMAGDLKKKKKGTGKGRGRGKGRGSGNAAPDEDETDAESTEVRKKPAAAVKPQAKAAVKPQAKAAIKPQAKAAKDKILGCPRCRHSCNGCHTCRNPTYGGTQTKKQWLKMHDGGKRR
jgi:hypothetical protein